MFPSSLLQWEGFVEVALMPAAVHSPHRSKALSRVDMTNHVDLCTTLAVPVHNQFFGLCSSASQTGRRGTTAGTLRGAQCATDSRGGRSCSVTTADTDKSFLINSCWEPSEGGTFVEQINFSEILQISASAKYVKAREIQYS